MRFNLNHIIRALAILPLMLFFFSCATYNQRITAYYSSMAQQDFTLAEKHLDKNKLLKAPRNRLLYLLEKGKLAHLMKEYEKSNALLNEADLYMEDARTSAKDIAMGTLLNPMMQTYKGEAFEQFMVHYYKAMNYLHLGKLNEALVEARRISLRSYELQDAVKESKYADDAFSLMLQGLIYEKAGDINNSFIAYRNSAEIFIRNNYVYYDVRMPEQLKHDLLRTAYLNGFYDVVERYENIFSMDYVPSADTLAPGGELVLFWENGMAPVKHEQQYFFTLNKNGSGNFVFTDATGGLNIPFYSGLKFDPGESGLDGIRSYRVAFPKYVEQPVEFNRAIASVNDTRYPLELTESINALAFASLRERFLKEMTLTLSRLAVKKLAEYAARPKEDDKNKKEKEALAMAVQIFNFASEKADTRNWQSLPHSIHYVRLPLKPGQNTVSLELLGLSSRKIDLNVMGQGGIQVLNLCTLL